MSHEEYRELCALRAYGELDADAAARLDEHLARCAACARLADELSAGLARLAPLAAEGCELPVGWRERLEVGLAGERRRSALLSPVALASASFLAGAALAWSVARPASPPEPGRAGRDQVAHEPPGPAREGPFELASAPPTARDRGALPLLELYLRR